MLGKVDVYRAVYCFRVAGFVQHYSNSVFYVAFLKGLSWFMEGIYVIEGVSW